MAVHIAVTASHGADNIGDATGGAYTLALGDIPKGMSVESVSVTVETVGSDASFLPVMFYVEVTVEAVRDL